MASETNPPDPVIDEVRAVRRRISAEFGHDPDRLVDHYMELQKRHGGRLIVPSTGGTDNRIPEAGAEPDPDGGVPWEAVKSRP